MAHLKRATQSEDGLAKRSIEPGPLAPARELLGELLLSLSRNREAEAVFEAVLRNSPNRFRSLAGAAVAAQAEGLTGVALVRYRLLLRNIVEADAPNSELAAAHVALDALRKIGVNTNACVA